MWLSQEKDKPNSTTMNGSPNNLGMVSVDGQTVKMEPVESESYSMSGSSSNSGNFGSPNGVKPISPEQEELIQRLVFFQNEYEQPKEEDIKQVSVSRKLSITRWNLDLFFNLFVKYKKIELDPI